MPVDTKSSACGCQKYSLVRQELQYGREVQSQLEWLMRPMAGYAGCRSTLSLITKCGDYKTDYKHRIGQ